MEFLKERFFLPVTLLFCVCVLLFIPNFSHASDNNDTDGDGLPDANETEVGRNPNFVEMHDWVANYDPDSSDWNATSDGNWTVVESEGNLTVRQSMNAPSTYFLTPYDLINVEVNGSIQVWGNSDNDFVGFYFGYKDSLNYFHFKWSRREAGVTSPLDGWNLIQVQNGASTRMDYDEANSSGPGWEMGVEHNFSLIYTEGNMTLRIKGNDSFSDYPVVFSHEGEFSAGKFGFWTGSQQDANFSNIKFTQLHPPEVTLLGNETVEHEAGNASYTDAGATASDVEDGNLTSSIAYSTDLNTSIPGSYTAVHSVKDSTDIERNSTRTITVVDTTSPVISLNPDDDDEPNETIHEAGDPWEEYGATWTDFVDGDGTANVNGTIDVNTTGTYYRDYAYTDGAGNVAEVVTRTIIVVDTTPATITLNPDGDEEANVTIHEAGQPWTDPGATWVDIVDGTGSADVNGTLNEDVVGTYYLDYNYTDEANNTAVVITRTIRVVDTTPAVIYLNGDAVVTHEAATDYSDSGAVWADFIDSNDTNSSSNIDVNDSMVDYSVPGNYTIVYTYVDAAGNEANATRTISVVDNTPPELFLTGGSNIDVGIWSEWIDPWAEANDSVDGNVTGDINSSGLPDMNTLGSYEVHYFVEDASGNQANITRTVNVVNYAPTDLNLSNGSVWENMPIGSLVSSFVVTDSNDPNYEKEYSFSIIETNQTDHQAFYIDNYGDLRILKQFDYELQNSASLLVEVKDEFNATYQKELQINIADASIPIIETTLSPEVASDGILQLGVSLTDAGGGADLLEWGVLVSRGSIDDMSSQGVQQMELSYVSGSTVSLTDFLPSSTWDVVYVRAYAINDEGIAYGLEERMDYSKQYLSWADARPVTGANGWWESEWLGNLYFTTASPWAMHPELGWFYPIASEDGSLWVWQNESGGWMWTSPAIYPFFYSTDSNGWRYFFGNVGSSQVFYDYGLKTWTDVIGTTNP